MPAQVVVEAITHPCFASLKEGSFLLRRRTVLRTERIAQPRQRRYILGGCYTNDRIGHRVRQTLYLFGTRTRTTAMPTTVADMTPAELRSLIAEVFEEKLAEVVDPDEGLKLRPEFVAKLREEM